MEGFKSEKDRLLMQFQVSMPMGMGDNYGDMEDVEIELDYMIEEGIDLKNITVRDVIKRFN